MASEAVKARLERLGQGVLQPEAGLSVLAAVLRGASATPSTLLPHPSSGPAAAVVNAPRPGPPVLCVNPFNWRRYLKQYGGGDGVEVVPAVPDLYRHVAQDLQATTLAAASAAAGAGAAGAARAQELAVAGPGGRDAIQREVEAALAEVLGATLPPDEPLMSGEAESVEGVASVFGEAGGR